MLHRMGWKTYTLVALLALASVGCAVPTPGAFTPAGFQHGDYALQVRAQADGAIMPESWVLDNYYEETTTAPSSTTPTAPTAASSGGADAPKLTTTTTLKLKDGPEYWASYYIDFDGDGNADKEWWDAAYALRYIHRETNGAIWLRAFPVSTRTGEKSLKALVENYVNGISGAGYDVVWVAWDTAVVSSAERTYASKIASGGAGTLGAQEMYEAIVDVANLDQLRLDPNHRYRRLHIVLARTPFTREFGPTSQTVALPVLALAVHANTPDDFDKTQADFISMLSRIAMNGQVGYGTTLDVAAADATLSAAGAPATEGPPPAAETAPAAEAPTADAPAAGAADGAAAGAAEAPAAEAPDEPPPASPADQ